MELEELETQKDQPDELWPPPCWPGHFCKRSLIQLRDSSGLAAQQPPYCFAVRYDLRPIMKQITSKSAYLALLDGETLRRIGKGNGLDVIAASKSWIARDALVAPPQLLARDSQGKLVGDLVAQPDPHVYTNGEGVLLMTVMLTSDIKDSHLWEPVGDLISYRLGSPPVQCGLCGGTVPLRDMAAHQNACPQVMTACPRCDKKVLMRELADHQRSSGCLSLSSAGMQTVDPETYDQESQCISPGLIPVAVQTSYSSALLAPELWAEEVVPALVPFAAIRWKAPPPQVRQLVTEYQLTVSEFNGCPGEWKQLRVELLGVGEGGELRHELTQLRPGTTYRLELQLRAADGSLGPKAGVTVHTLSRLAGFEGLSEEERLQLSAAMESGKGRPESISVREQATQAGPGFVTGACKSEISREIGVQVFPKVFSETACQIDPIVPVQMDSASGPEWPLLSTAGVQCKAASRDYGTQCETKSTSSACQAQFPPRPQTADQRAELELDLHSGVPGWREVLQQVGFAELLRFALVFVGNAMALVGIFLAELPPQEMWPMLASLIVLLPFNALELLFFEMLPPSRRAATKLRIWRRRHPNMNAAIQAAVVTATPEALQLYRAPLQPGGRRFTGIVGPSPEALRVPGASELCAAKCPLCQQLSPIPRLADLYRSTRFLMYCHLPQLGLALYLLLKRLDSMGNDLDIARAVIHGGTSLAHGLLSLWVLALWAVYRCRRRSQRLHVADLMAEPKEEALSLRWPDMAEVLCEFWYVIFHSFDRQNILRIEMLSGKKGSDSLQLDGVPPGHYWISVLSWHRSGGLSMPLAMGHCEVPGAEELQLKKRPAVSDAQTEIIPEVQDMGTDPMHVQKPMADAEVQNVVASVDAVVQYPSVPVELVDAVTEPLSSTSSEHRVASAATGLGSFDLPVMLSCEDHPNEPAPEGARGLWLSWEPFGLQELAPRLVAKARHLGGEGLVFGAMALNRASFQLEVGRYELLLNCELGHCQAEVQRCPHPRCQQRFWAQDLEAHVSRCPWKPVPCPRADDGCSWQGCSDELAEHEQECPAAEVRCRHRALGCRWVGPGTLELRHLETCNQHRVVSVAEALEALLSEACPDFRNPEFLQLLSQAVAYRRYVRPCGQWKEWKSTGTCSSCSKTIDRKEKGLQCESPSQRLCWACMPSLIDWQRLRDDVPR